MKLVLLNALPFIVVIILMGIGYHDVGHPQTALVSGLKWWFLIGGFFLYMMLWNAYDEMNRGHKETRITALGLWWFSFCLSNPSLAGALVPILRLGLLYLLMNGVSFVLQTVFQ